MAQLLSGNVSGGRDGLKRITEGGKQFSAMDEGETSVPLTLLPSLSLSQGQAFVGAVFCLIESHEFKIFAIVTVSEQLVEARELLRRPAAAVQAASASSATFLAATPGSPTQSQGQQPALDGLALAAAQSPQVGSVLSFPVAGMSLLNLLHGEPLATLRSEFPDIPGRCVVALLGLEGREPVLRLYRQAGDASERVLVATLKLKVSGSDSTAGGGAESGGDKAAWDVPMATRGIFEKGATANLFEGKSRVLNLASMYNRCVMLGSEDGNERVRGDARFDTNTALYICCPHQELQRLLRFDFVGLRFFQSCDRLAFGGYMGGISKAGDVPLIRTGKGAVEALENLLALMQRAFSRFKPSWIKAWAVLQKCAGDLEKARHLVGMDYHGLLCCVLDTILLGWFDSVSNPAVSDLDVLASLEMLSFDYNGPMIERLNRELSRAGQKGGGAEAKVGDKRPAEGHAKHLGCFDFFTVESTCSLGVNCKFSHEASDVSPGEVNRLCEKIRSAGKTPVAALLV